jgi:phosphoribosylformylglycinamidine cyclo-ligase
LKPQNDAYSRAGVDLGAGARATDLMAAAVRSTYGPQVLAGIGAFGGIYDFDTSVMKSPALVASMDGVGTKTKVAAQMNRWNTIGHDLVNHCVNDILVQGAWPMFFLDYVASSNLDSERVAMVVSGVAAACRQAGCALLGGETAEMPGVYEPGEVDLVGTIVGVVDRDKIIDGRAIRPGDVILGLPSTGLHTNGYSLARHALADLDWTVTLPELGCSVGDALLAIHRSYLSAVQALQAAGVDLHGLAHITGGGLHDNLPRIFQPGIGATIRRGSWQEPPIFGLIQRMGHVSDEEMFHVFNMGLGMLAIMPADHVALAQSAVANELNIVGEVTLSDSGVVVDHD